MSDNNAPARDAPVPAPAPVAPPPSANLGRVVAAAGVEIYALLTPRDLCSLSMSNRALSEDVRQNLILVCCRQQAMTIKSTTPDDSYGHQAHSSVVISRQHSFTSRRELAECLYEKIKRANLRHDPLGFSVQSSPDMLETLALVRNDLRDDSSWFGTSWYGSFKDVPKLGWEPLRKPCSIGCRFEDELLGGRHRRCFIDWMLRKLGQEYPSVNQPSRDWARFVIAQRGLVGREWYWELDGEEAVGFMIYSMTGDPQLEIRITKNVSQETAIPAPNKLLSAFSL